MQNLVINTDKAIVYAAKDASGRYKSDETGEFQITSIVQNIGLRVGVPIVFLSGSNSDAVFVNTAEVTSVGKVITLPPKLDVNYSRGLPNTQQPRPTYIHEAKFQISKELVQNNLLADLEYSLKSIYRYNNPKVHFHQQYRTLPEADFETITNGWIYSVRTVFGKLVNALPRQNKLEFMILSMNEFSTIDFKRVLLRDGLKFLNDYIERRILSRGKLLVETNRLIKTHLGDLLKSEEIGFVNQDSEKENLLSIQSEIFSDLFKLGDEQKLTTVLRESEQKNIETERRFDKLFDNETWPIDLRA